VLTLSFVLCGFLSVNFVCIYCFITITYFDTIFIEDIVQTILFFLYLRFKYVSRKDVFHFRLLSRTICGQYFSVNDWFSDFYYFSLFS